MAETEIIRDKNSVKLTKNTKGYSWEIRIVDKEGQNMLKEIEEKDLWFRKKYGGKGDDGESP